jgi:hypothetical protein
MAVSQNGWSVSPPRTARTVPGTEVRVTVADGPAGDVLMYVLGRVDREVEDIDLRSTRGEFDDWGYADRTVRGSTDTSNHASATAVDVNATRHPLGKPGTFNAAQVARIHRILADVDHVVRWGGDYTGRKDEMHFEINAPHVKVAAVAARLATSGGFLMALSDGDQQLVLTAAKRVMGMLQQRYYKKNPDGTVGQSGADGVPAAALDTLDGNFIVRQILDTQKLLTEVKAQLAAVRGEQVTDSDLERELAELEAKFAPVLKNMTTRKDDSA